MQAPMSSQGSYLDALKRVIDEVVTPGAASVDADGAFPRAQLDALGADGILALTVPAAYGGGDAAGGDGGGVASGPMTLWLVPADAAGLSAAGAFDGLGLRGNASVPLTADGLVVPLSAMLGADGGGLDLALAAILPSFLICSAAMSAGLIRRLATETADHLQRTRLAHLGLSLAQQAGPRAQLPRLALGGARTWAHISDALSAVEDGRPDAT